MTQKTFTLTMGLVFLLIGALHALRLFLGWDAVIGGWHVPRLASYVAIVFCAYFSYTALRLSR